MKVSLKRIGCLLLAAMPLCAQALLEDLPLIGSRFPYSIQIEGKPELAEEFSEALSVQREESEEFSQFTTQYHANRFDRDILQKLLKSEGYYAAKVASQVYEDKIQYRIDTGPLYRIASVTMDFPQGISPPKLDTLAVAEGGAMRAKDILDSTSTLREYVASNYCLYELELNYKARINHNTRQGLLTFHLKPSQQVNFAAPQLFGTTEVSPEYLKHYITFEKGQCFNRTEIERTRVALLQTNLLSRVDVVVGPPVADQVTVTFDVNERNHRTVKVGAGYSTDIGANALLGWEHRNFFGSGQKLETELNFSKVEQSLTGELQLPNFLRDDQTLSIRADITKEDTRAYESLESEVSATISRPLRRHMNVSLGIAQEISRVTKDGETEEYSFFSIPAGFDFNNADNLFNPSEGVGLALKARPYINLAQTGIRFIEYSAVASTYLSREHWPLEPTLALRLAAGTLQGESLSNVPGDHRFYVGGGGSVRGYEYQTLSALDGDEPVGGLSFSESSVELRLQFSESWGAVLFADGGFAYPGQTPEFFSDYLTSWGLGIRFFTAFAPIRFDVARPNTIRYDSETGERIDDPYQIYISIGQAF